VYPPDRRSCPDDCLSIPPSPIRQFDDALFHASAQSVYLTSGDEYLMLEVTRGAKTVEVKVRLGERPMTIAHALMRGGEEEMAQMALVEYKV
jgi:hypothetical protein